MTGSRQERWAEALALHASATAGFAADAAAVVPERWAVPRAPGKWSPAQVVQHLILAYEVLLRELAGGPGMALHATWWQRFLLRLIFLPRLLAGAPFPPGARAPREVRPPETAGDREEAVARFRALAAEFTAAVEETRARSPRKRLTHAYFGATSLEDAVRLCARHIQHHRQQLPAPDAQPNAV
ncbi:MAG TPA: DinB family protein [Longimicrobiaceae bacterium]|nr:DinB family protein [Longimicrobiaceae bacterium]